MLAIGKGAEQEILAQMRLLGTNNIVVTPTRRQKEGEVKTEQAATPKKFTPGLRYADAQAIVSTIPNVDASSSEIVLNTLITREGRHRSAKLVGVDLELLPHHEPAVFVGRGVHRRPGAQRAAGGRDWRRLKAASLPRIDPQGQTIKVGQNWLTVVGVLADRPVSGQNAQRLGIRDANLDVYIPATTMLLRYRNRALVTQQEIEAASKMTTTTAKTTSRRKTQRFAPRSAT
jgi:putative ABC transport system permease protein